LQRACQRDASRILEQSGLDLLAKKRGISIALSAIESSTLCSEIQ